MTRAVLFTQCLQNDFVRLIEPYDALPNALHVGYAESLRLLGERAEEGPLLLALGWAYAQPADKLSLFHIRDWHDPENPDEKAHLERFSPHCLKGTPGAEFVFGPVVDQDRPHTIIDSGGLNDFHNTELSHSLTLLGLDRGPVRAGITGVWTEAKVSFLAYELTTRYPEWEVAVCSALCAGSSRASHLIALDQLESLLGVKVFYSVSDFTQFLNGTSPQTVTRKNSRTDAAKLHVSGIQLSPEDETLALYIFRGAKDVTLKGLDGGFSGNVVLRASSTDPYGHVQVPTVVKMGPRSLIAQERVSFERIQEVLGNNAPSIVDSAELGSRGVIQYRYAAMLDGKVTCFQDLYQAGAPPEEIQSILERVFRHQLGRLYEASGLEKINLLAYYDFQAKYADGVDSRVKAILDETGEGAPGRCMETEILPGFYARDLGNFYRNEVEAMAEQGTRLHHTSFVHGDLNGRNILVDPQGNVWIIDFFHTNKGHVIRDLVKLENDLAFIFTPIPDQERFLEAAKLSGLLWSHPDLGRAPPPLQEKIHPDLERFWQTLQTLRGYEAELIRSDRSPFQHHVAALRYAVHTLGFEECTLWQKRWALHTAAVLVQKIRATHSGTQLLRVDKIPGPGPGFLGITILPGRKDRDRDILVDLKSLQLEKTQRVLCLVTENELILYGVANLIQNYQDQGLKVMHLPVADGGVPTLDQLDEALSWLQAGISTGENAVIHCVGGLGRSGIFAAAYLMRYTGLSSSDAIKTVRETRSPRAVENQLQEKFLQGLDSEKPQPPSL